MPDLYNASPTTAARPSWRDVYPVHPAADLFPMLPHDELLELGKDIKKHGMQVPIVFWSEEVGSKYHLLDGRNRLDAMEAVGHKFSSSGIDALKVPYDIVFGEAVRSRFGDVSDIVEKIVDPYSFVLSANIHRRHLTAEQKRKLIAKVVKAKPEASNRQIAAEVKAHHETVGAVRKELESTGEIRQLEKTIGKDGKARTTAPKREPKPKPAPEDDLDDQLLDEDDREKSVTSLRSNVSLEVWKTLDEPTRALLLDPSGITAKTGFNEQKNEAIEWAQWSWNPITGCQHPCSYCYARDIATSTRMAKAYPNGFAPSFRPNALAAPFRVKVPKDAERDTRFKNVFTCSMADMFGRWVPAEWINAVLDAVRANPQWNFLFLTKFPKRMAEFDIPPNAWMGTTVDFQSRVKNAEEAFSKVNASVKWLSVEPMLEPLKFERLDLFNWIVIGGASAQSKTPEWKPPFRWIANLTRQADDAGVKVYHKTNLLGSRALDLPFDAPIKRDPDRPHDSFFYLGKAKGLASADPEPEAPQEPESVPHAQHEPPKSGFAIERDIPVPAAKRGRAA